MPFNGDSELVERITRDYAEYVPSVYGSLRRDGIGGGRVLDDKHPDSLESLSPIIRRLESKGIEFNYVVSGPSAMNREFTPEYRESFLVFIGRLRDIGIPMVTLANVSLIELTRSHFPELKVSASVNLRTKTVEDVAYVLSLGCEEMTLHYDTFKDPRCLSAIRSLTTIDLKLIPNDIFIMGCPWHKAHSLMQAAHTRSKDLSTPYFNYYRNKCVNLRHRMPDEIMKAMWIPPSRIDAYEKLGYDYFKLLDRYASTEWIIKALQAYLARTTSSLEQILGTYGDIATDAAPQDFQMTDAVYDSKKLEVIPSINLTSPESNRALRYFVSPNHPQECGTCSMCAEATTADVGFVQLHVDKALANNHLWQQRVTSRTFIQELEAYQREPGYR